MRSGHGTFSMGFRDVSLRMQHGKIYGIEGIARCQSGITAKGDDQLFGSEITYMATESQKDVTEPFMARNR